MFKAENKPLIKKIFNSKNKFKVEFLHIFSVILRFAKIKRKYVSFFFLQNIKNLKLNISSILKFNYLFFYILLSNRYYFENYMNYFQIKNSYLFLFKNNKILLSLEYLKTKDKLFLFSSNIFRYKNLNILPYSGFLLRVNIFTFFNLGFYNEYFRLFKYNEYIKSNSLNKFNLIFVDDIKEVYKHSIFFQRFNIYDDTAISHISRITITSFFKKKETSQFKYYFFSNLHLNMLFYKIFYKYFSLTFMVYFYKCFFEFPSVLKEFIGYRCTTLKGLLKFLRLVRFNISKVILLYFIKKPNIEYYNLVDFIPHVQQNFNHLFYIELINKVWFTLIDKFDLESGYLLTSEFNTSWEVLSEWFYLDYNVICQINNVQDFLIFLNIFKYNLEQLTWQILNRFKNFRTLDCFLKYNSIDYKINISNQNSKNLRFINSIWFFKNQKINLHYLFIYFALSQWFFKMYFSHMYLTYKYNLELINVKNSQFYLYFWEFLWLYKIRYFELLGE